MSCSPIVVPTFIAYIIPEHNRDMRHSRTFTHTVVSTTLPVDGFEPEQTKIWGTNFLSLTEFDCLAELFALGFDCPSYRGSDASPEEPDPRFLLADWAHMWNLNHALFVRNQHNSGKTTDREVHLIFQVRKHSLIQHDEQKERIS